jgi:hypothetical protein
MTDVFVLDEGSMCNKKYNVFGVSARPYLLLIIWIPPASGSDIRHEYGQFLSCLAYAGTSNSPERAA